MIFSVLSIFLTVILGASSVMLGIMEGVSDFAASSLDFISGYLSDKTKKRKIFAIFGYGFSTVAKGILLLANTVTAVVSFRIVERLGKSIRGAPRDALISSVADKSKLGFSFGFHKALDKAGAILGPFVAYGLLTFYGQTASTFNTLFWIALVPAALAVVVFALFIKDHPPATEKTRDIRIFKIYHSLGKDFKKFIKISGVFSLGYFSYAFLMLKANLVGYDIKDITLLYALFNISFVIFSIPAGKFGDKIGRKKIILAEYLIYALLCIGFVFAQDKLTVGLLFLVYGIFYAIDEGQSKAYISSITPDDKRASAIGLYSFITGIVYLPASLIAGALWNIYSPAYAFGFAAFTASAAFILFFFQKPNNPQTKPQIIS
jgi:MFS family permease